MNREQLISLIFGIKAEAIKAGFDWPTNDSPDGVATETLRDFLYEILRFLEEKV